MLDPRREAVLVWSKSGTDIEDKTHQILRHDADSSQVRITYRNNKEYPYPPQRVVVLADPIHVPLNGSTFVEVDGRIWDSTVELWRFDGREKPWWRVFYSTRAGENYRTTQHVRILGDASQTTKASHVLDYWRTVVSRLNSSDPIRPPYANLRFIHPESVLARYLNGEAIDTSTSVEPLIFPFSSNLSQREAVRKALNHPLSATEGPPGNGKTQTILNLIANIILEPGTTVGVVSYSNAAVDNVREKLTKLGFGYVMAGLGNEKKKAEFFEDQENIHTAVNSLVDSAPIPTVPTDQLAEIVTRLHSLQQDDQRLKQTKAELQAFRLERRHFTAHFDRQELPELERLPLLRRSSTTILDFIAEAELGPDHGAMSRLVGRIKRYLRYGPTRGLDPADTDVVLRLQRAFYDKKITELQRSVDRLSADLENANLKSLAEQHRQLSVQALRSSLQQRYSATARKTYRLKSYRHQFADFTRNYPVVLSTCHSLRRSLPRGYLLDYLIIDEASQVDLLAASLAMSAARNVVIVGDRRQLPHIASAEAADVPAPSPTYDYVQHNILSSVFDLYGESLPHTLLREHYRCDPAIINFCNKKFYDGDLIPYTEAAPDTQAMVLARTTEGNHMRQHRGGGRSNQREIDVIRDEIIPEYCPDVSDSMVGITTPYRLQADRVADALIESIKADTVHKFQGRDSDTMIMTTVLDETWRGHTGTKFVDDPHLVNVAVSRAIRRFILVTNHSMLPKSRNLRDLIDYIRYYDPDHEVVDSCVVSVFDLLYREYSARLRPLAHRLKADLPYKSEDIIWTVLQDIRTEPQYADLDIAVHVLLHNVLTDLDGLTPEQAAFVKNRASFDFLIFNKVTNRLLLTIEVDGFKYHEDNPAQLARDALKDQICAARRIPLLRLPTTGSGEERLIREKLDAVLAE